MKPTNQVSNLINCLTNDEDQRQELWLHYLSGNPAESLSLHLEKLKIEYSIEQIIKNKVYDIVNNPPSDKFYQLLNHFSEVEKSIVTLLALGLSVVQVSKYKEISEVRIRQVIAIIKDNDCWEELYGSEKKIDTRGTIRT